MDEMRPAQRRHYVALRDRFEAGVRELIDAGVAAGKFRPTQVSLAGFAILGSLNWMPKSYREDGPLARRAITEWFADFFSGALKR
jgi:hypothetical protein